MGKNEQERHGAEDAPDSGASQVDSDHIPSTRPRLDQATRLAKRSWRRSVQELSSIGAESRRMGHNARSYLGRTVADGDPAAPSLAHVYAASLRVRRAVALDLLANCDAEEFEPDEPVAFEQQALLLHEDMGQLSGTLRRALADGRLDREELQALLEDGQRLLANGNAFCRDVRKALDALDGAR